MSKRVVLYDLSALVTDDLVPQAEDIAENLGLAESRVSQAISSSSNRYNLGEISQGQHWEDVAFKLGLEETDVLQAFAENTANVDQELLGRVRAQSPLMTLGLVSDATPDWVNQWRRQLQLDQLLHVHVIGSELQQKQSYQDLLKIAAERLQSQPAQINFVSKKPRHLNAAKSVGMKVLDITSQDYASAFKNL